jgi:hypothetical protein
MERKHIDTSNLPSPSGTPKASKRKKKITSPSSSEDSKEDSSSQGSQESISNSFVQEEPEEPNPLEEYKDILEEIERATTIEELKRLQHKKFIQYLQEIYWRF